MKKSVKNSISNFQILELIFLKKLVKMSNSKIINAQIPKS